MKWLVGVLAILLFPVSALAGAPSIIGNDGNITVVSGSLGPHILGSTRGRLVVACDMQSDTCSDGRKITTTRSTPVPCEVSPGVWEMVRPDEGCYSVRGLESWAANTSYVNHGADLTKWIKHPDMTLEVLDPQGFRLTGLSSGADINSGFVPALEGERWTAACFMRESPLGPASIRIRAGNATAVSPCEVTPGVSWKIHSCTHVRTADGNGALFIHTRTSSVDVLACWSTKTATPGRPCWGGEAPVTCAGDRHTISTDGWPTESGEISLVYTPQDGVIGAPRYLAATTGGGEGQPSGFYLYIISETGALVFGLRRGDTIQGQNTQNLVWEPGRSYHVRVRWSPERAEIWRDGILLRSWVPIIVPDSHSSTAAIGATKGGTGLAQGSIRSLTVRSYEEVSP